MLPARAKGMSAALSVPTARLRTERIFGSGARSGIDERVPWQGGPQTPLTDRPDGLSTPMPGIVSAAVRPRYRFLRADFARREDAGLYDERRRNRAPDP